MHLVLGKLQGKENNEVTQVFQLSFIWNLD